jgi:hypothetical protein
MTSSALPEHFDYKFDAISIHRGIELPIYIERGVWDQNNTQQYGAGQNKTTPRYLRDLARDLDIDEYNYIIVRKYESHQKIQPHIHAKTLGPVVYTLSVGSDVKMTFQKKNIKFSLTLPERSLFTIQGEIRDEWEQYTDRPVYHELYLIYFYNAIEDAE